ncbi:MAG: phosphate ABC transporter permease PstA [bacterium]|nr:phosphate ABC transporter permease PstA [bacterium]
MAVNTSARDSVPVMVTSLGLVLILLMLGLVLWLILSRGLASLWPHPLERFDLHDGRVVLGEVWEELEGPEGARLRLRVGNRELTGQDVVLLDLSEVSARQRPADAILVERHENGVFVGWLAGIEGPGLSLAGDSPELRRRLDEAIRASGRLDDQLRERQERARRLSLKRGRWEEKLARRDGPSPGADRLQGRMEAASVELRTLDAELDSLYVLAAQWSLVMRTSSSDNVSLPLLQVVRWVPVNELGTPARLGLYLKRLWGFLSEEPRESNTAGGVWPAIFGTVLMVLLMSLAAAPLGVMTAVYLHDYAKQGLLVRLIRLAVNNLAGVPSIVFGIFGLGFFIYFTGGSLDQLFFSERLPEPTYGTGGILWASLTLALLTLPVVVVATLEGLAAVSRTTRMAALALGATRWQMIRQVVLPNAMPGILTGLILAVSRAAGEVAPLMITGVVKLAPSLALDGDFPFLHLERKFMHLGFHIYDLGFQSPNVEAAKPMLYATALLLICMVLLLNLTAILLRNHLRKVYKQAAF